ncbi:putative phenylacetate-CoA ligase [Jimgerdemannia flammicorona]|uniref:Putative phenylacetate-CoA ligase n=1 Tax=Jimgerdemannia flammicorona TaxID=994334 RepID=A0A433QKG8_9FUNG|nr:putative phenylacetate-CoA ligase [Jimgerdemannia flammicorona]
MRHNSRRGADIEAATFFSHTKPPEMDSTRISAYLHFLRHSLDDLVVPALPLSANAQNTQDLKKLEDDRLALAKQRVLHLFSQANETVPAYANFLTTHRVIPQNITTFDLFQHSVPTITKANYINFYPLPDRCHQSTITAFEILHASSGSSGVPTFWGRNAADELANTVRFEQLFRDSFRAHELKTLVVMALPMGAWVGGLYTTNCVRNLSTKGYPVTLVTPGNDVSEILKCVRQLGGMFEQIVICGYPPFVKTAIDAGRAQGIDWAPFRLKLVLAGEVFSEEWRELVSRRGGIGESTVDVVSIYGTADAGPLANETPLSAHIRAWLSTRPDVAKRLFGRDRLPTLLQYDPVSKYLEIDPRSGTLIITPLPLVSTDDGGEVAITAPLLRYGIGDAGGVITFVDMLEFLAKEGMQEDPVSTVNARLGRATIRPLPFAYLFGRAHWTVSLYGANVYVENVMVGLEQPALNDLVSGKFILSTTEDEDGDIWLSVVVELALGIEPSIELERTIAESIKDSLVRLNSEYANYVPEEKRVPRVLLVDNGDPQRFPVGVKHRYV